MNKTIIIIIFATLLLSCGMKLNFPGSNPQLQDNAGFPYLQDWDSYHWYHEAQNHHLESPMACISYYFWQFFRLFNHNLTLMGAMSYLPIFIMGLVILNIIFIVYMLTGDYMGGLIGGLLLAINPQVFHSSRIGVADTQLLIYFFMTAFILLFLMFVDNLKEVLYGPSPKETFIRAVYLFIMCFMLSKVNLLITHNPMTSFGTVLEHASYGVYAVFFMDHLFLVMFAMIFSISYLLVTKRKYTIKLIISSFFILLLLSGFQIRFILYAIILYCIIMGVAMNDLIEYIARIKDKSKAVEYANAAAILIPIVFSFVCLTNIPIYRQQTIIADDGMAALDIPKDAEIINHWPSGYMIQAFTNHTSMQFSGNPSSSYLLYDGLRSGNESLFMINLNSKYVYIVLTEQDIDFIITTYGMNPGSNLYKMMTNNSKLFEQVYQSRSKYNRVWVWRAR